MIRIADKNDLPEILALLSQRKYLMGDPVTQDTLDAYSDKFHRYSELTDEYDSIFLVSVDADGSIVAAARQLFLIKYNKSWIFSDLVTRPGNSYFTPAKSGVDEIMNYFINRAESRGFYSYSFIMEAGKNWANRTLDMRNQISVLHRYDYYDEALILAGTLPDVLRYKDLMGRKPWKSDLVVRMGVLKNEYRDKELLIVK